MSGDAVLLPTVKAVAVGPGTPALPPPFMSAGGARPVGVEVRPGPVRRGEKPVMPILPDSAGELGRWIFKLGLVDAEGPWGSDGGAPAGGGGSGGPNRVGE